jgi:hypothetical protein
MNLKSLMNKGLVLVLMFVIYSLLYSVSYAAHPLVTDDTGTQGKEKFQIEVNSEFTREKEREWDDNAEDWVTIKQTGGEVATILSYGVTDNLDVVLGFPYQWKKTKIDGVVTEDPREQGDGMVDISLELKWRFFEKDGLSFALKPGVTFPTGDEKKGLGNGRMSYGITFITTKELGPGALHFNLGYTHNEYKLQEDKDANRKGIWHVSLASEVEVVKDLKAVANIGIERNPDKTSNTHPAFILGGLIYSITDKIDISFGIKGGLNKPADDLSILAGIALKF